MKITNALLTLLLVSPVFNKSDLELYKEKHPDISLDKPLLERRANPYCDGDGPIDWRESGCVSPVKNQGSCGSSYAFSAVGALEFGLCHSGIGVCILSEQQVIDCSYNRYSGMNQGCASGRSDVALQYANEQAISCQSNYPYKQTRGSCAVRSGPPPYKVNYEQIKVANEEELECLVRKGPVIAYIYVCPRLQMYKSGIFNDATCYGKVNQAVLIVGMGQTTDGVEYWIIKNSWGSKWGNEGYFSIVKGQNMCSIIDNPIITVSVEKR